MQKDTNTKEFLGHMIAGSPGNSIELDKIDKKIIAELSINARVPFTSIAKRIGISREHTAYRVERLKKRGILTGTLTLINPRSFNARIYEIYLRIKKLTKERSLELTEYFVKHTKTQWVATCGSTWDYAITIVCRTLENLDDTITEIKEHVGENITEIRIHPVLYDRDTWHPYTDEQDTKINIIQRLTTWKGKDDGSYQKYFVNYKQKQQSPRELNNADRKILSAIEKDARKTITAISKETKYAQDTVRKRLKELILQGTIQKFIPVLSAPLLGLQWELVFLQVDTYNKSRISAIEAMFNTHPAIAYVSRVTASQVTYVLSIMVQDARHFNEVLTDMRTTFSDIIKTFEHVTIFESHKYSYLTKFVKDQKDFE